MEESKERKSSEARIRANAKYNKKVYDTASVYLPKGTKERILATGNSVNGFVTQAVLERLEKLEEDLLK